MSYSFGYTMPSGISQCPHCGLQIAYAPQKMEIAQKMSHFDINCPNPECNVELRLLRKLDETASGQWFYTGKDVLMKKKVPT